MSTSLHHIVCKRLRNERGDVPRWVLVTIMTAGMPRVRLSLVFNTAIPPAVASGGRDLDEGS